MRGCPSPSLSSVLPKVFHASVCAVKQVHGKVEVGAKYAFICFTAELGMRLIG